MTAFTAPAGRTRRLAGVHVLRCPRPDSNREPTDFKQALILHHLTSLDTALTCTDARIGCEPRHAMSSGFPGVNRERLGSPGAAGRHLQQGPTGDAVAPCRGHCSDTIEIVSIEVVATVGSLIVSLAAVAAAFDANRRADRREASARADAAAARLVDLDRAERRAAYAAFIARAREYAFLTLQRGDVSGGAELPSPPELQKGLWEASGMVRLLAPEDVNRAVDTATTSLVLYYIDLDQAGAVAEPPWREITEAEEVMRADLRGARDVPPNA